MHYLIIKKNDILKNMIVNSILYATSTQKGHVPLLSYTRITAHGMDFHSSVSRGFSTRKKHLVSLTQLCNNNNNYL